MTPTITVELFAEPVHLDAAHLDDFRVGFTVKNIGPAVLDPQLSLSELRVNGTPSHDWGMALMNGGRESKWKALPPGERITRTWPLARELFPRPGDYQLVLTVAGVSSAPVVVHVTP